MSLPVVVAHRAHGSFEVCRRLLLDLKLVTFRLIEVNASMSNPYIKRTLAIGGSIIKLNLAININLLRVGKAWAQLVSCLTRLDLTKNQIFRYSNVVKLLNPNL